VRLRAGLMLSAGCSSSESSLAHAPTSDLLRRLGHTADAPASYERALKLTRQESEQRFIVRRLNELAPTEAGLPDPTDRRRVADLAGPGSRESSFTNASASDPLGTAIRRGPALPLRLTCAPPLDPRGERPRRSRLRANQWTAPLLPHPDGWHRSVRF